MIFNFSIRVSDFSIESMMYYSNYISLINFNSVVSSFGGLPLLGTKLYRQYYGATKLLFIGISYPICAIGSLGPRSTMLFVFVGSFVKQTIIHYTVRPCRLLYISGTNKYLQIQSEAFQDLCVPFLTYISKKYILFRRGAGSEIKKYYIFNMHVVSRIRGQYNFIYLYVKDITPCLFLRSFPGCNWPREMKFGVPYYSAKPILFKLSLYPQL